MLGGVISLIGIVNPRREEREACAARRAGRRADRPAVPRGRAARPNIDAPMGDRFTLSLRAYRWVAYAALATLVLIVFSGAGVRLTGSGLGCPTWPDCSGTFVPELDTHVWIEYGNRLFSTVVGIACIAAGVLAFRVRPLRRDLLRPATVLAVGVIAQGVLGGITVAAAPDLAGGHRALPAVDDAAGGGRRARVARARGDAARAATGSSSSPRACSSSTAPS